MKELQVSSKIKEIIDKKHKARHGNGKRQKFFERAEEVYIDLVGSVHVGGSAGDTLADLLDAFFEKERGDKA